MEENYSLTDFMKKGWPKEGVKYYTSALHDIPETVNKALVVLRRKKVLYALVYVPTSYKIIPNGDTVESSIKFI